MTDKYCGWGFWSRLRWILWPFRITYGQLFYRPWRSGWPPIFYAVFKNPVPQLIAYDRGWYSPVFATTGSGFWDFVWYTLRTLPYRFRKGQYHGPGWSRQ